MKKKYLIIVLFLSMFLNINTVIAASSLTCNTNVIVGDNIECNVTIETDPVMVVSDGNIKISDLNGTRYSKLSETKVIFYESGNVLFGPASESFTKYTISLKNEKGISAYAADVKVMVIKKTSTTTTTRKKSSNNYLLKIMLNDKLLEGFTNTKTRYYVNYPYEVEKVNIVAETEDYNARLEINGPKKLEVGDNEYTIGVTSEDNTTRFYKIVITRAEKEKVLSSNTKLSEIDIDGYKLNFDGNSKTYYLTIDKDITKLSLAIKTDDKNATYKIIGNKNLKDGSIIKIIVTAENEEVDTYRIIITKKDNNILIPIIIVIILGIISLLVFFINIKKKKKPHKKDKKMETKKEKDNVLKEDTKVVDLEKTIEVKTLNNQNTIAMDKLISEVDMYKEDD